MLNSLSKDELIVGSVLDDVVRNYNRYLNNKIVCESGLKTYKFREYTLCVLFNSAKNIYISLCHKIPGANYNRKYQVTGGKVDFIDRKKKDYFLEYAKHKALEESGVILGNNNLIYVVIEENSRIFPKRETEDIYRIAVYIANIGDITLQCKEPDKNTKNRCKPKRKRLNFNDSESPKEEIINEVIENCEVVENCVVINCDSINCNDINNNSINHTEDEKIEEEILKIVQ
ncbi:10316_t:CDS:2 [Scutellospora calospora]|uniref:10316_t:CDS:1 n=1 Tax=Scutellospora calospora TaxID=85575 RepID=A0ACA9KLN1_9GLOM|nr:10316_t:CDS:2 [Scutellospora calospora]